MFDVMMNIGMWLAGFAIPVTLVSMMLLGKEVEKEEEVK